MSQPQSTVSLRPLVLDDLPKVLAIENACYLPQDAQPWTEDHFKAELDKPYARVMVLTDDETDTEIMGYVVYWLLDETAEILNIAVSLSHRGLGYAKKLFAHVVQEAIRAEKKKVTLEVRKSNAPAIQLYQKMRMTITQIRKGFYSNGESAYHFELPLDGDVLAELEF